MCMREAPGSRSSFVVVLSACAIACGGASACGGAQCAGHGHGHRASAGEGGGSGHHHGEGATHDFSDVARFEAMFDAPGRAAWQRPVEVVQRLGASAGEVVVDLGTGTGYFLPFLSLAVGPAGRVVALDSEPAMVAHVRQRAAREGLANVDAREVTAADPGLAPASVDRVLIVDTWHHVPERAAYAARLRDALRPGGTVLVVDFTREADHGPPPEMRLPPETVVTELAAAGLDAAIDADETLPDQYVVRATRRRR